MGSLRVLQIVEHYSALGGIPELVENLADELKHIGHQVRVVSTRSRHHDREPVQRRGDADCVYLKLRSSKPRSWRHLERLIREPLDARAGELALGDLMNMFDFTK
jgi:hypothetical protein